MGAVWGRAQVLAWGLVRASHVQGRLSGGDGPLDLNLERHVGIFQAITREEAWYRHPTHTQTTPFSALVHLSFTSLSDFSFHSHFPPPKTPLIHSGCLTSLRKPATQNLRPCCLGSVRGAGVGRQSQLPAFRDGKSIEGTCCWWSPTYVPGTATDTCRVTLLTPHSTVRGVPTSIFQIWKRRLCEVRRKGSRLASR